MTLSFQALLTIFRSVVERVSAFLAAVWMSQVAYFLTQQSVPISAVERIQWLSEWVSAFLAALALIRLLAQAA